MADEFSKCQQELVGIGGFKCSCCNCLHGKDKARLNRIARRRFKRKIKKDIEKELTPDTE